MIDTHFILGVDGGGSKTVALLADAAGQIIGRGSAGPSNQQVVGFERACATIESAIMTAFADAQIEPQPVAAMCLGLAGVDRPEDHRRFQAWANTCWPHVKLSIANDATLVLAAGTPDGWGLALVGGTGSIAYGRDAHGRHERAGGWGYLLGDEGSSYAIGLAALQAVTRAADGRAAPTMLMDAILGHWALPTPQALIGHVYGGQLAPVMIAGLAMLVEETAAAGDAVAQEIIAEACHELALALHAVARRLELPAPTPCALAGGLLLNRPRVAEGVLHAARKLELQLDPVTLVAEPALGAVRVAARLCESAE
jgi:N-acetylmuramic acid 6-phosphate etherase